MLEMGSPEPAIKLQVKRLTLRPSENNSLGSALKSLHEEFHFYGKHKAT